MSCNAAGFEFRSYLKGIMTVPELTQKVVWEVRAV